MNFNKKHVSLGVKSFILSFLLTISFGCKKNSEDSADERFVIAESKRLSTLRQDAVDLENNSKKMNIDLKDIDGLPLIAKYKSSNKIVIVYGEKHFEEKIYRRINKTIDTLNKKNKLTGIFVEGHEYKSNEMVTNSRIPPIKYYQEIESKNPVPHTLDSKGFTPRFFVETFFPGLEKIGVESRPILELSDDAHATIDVRNSNFVKHIKKSFNNEDKVKIFLFPVGYAHLRGLKILLDDTNISYLIVTPSLNELIGKGNRAQVFSRLNERHTKSVVNMVSLAKKQGKLKGLERYARYVENELYSFKETVKKNGLTKEQTLFHFLQFIVNVDGVLTFCFEKYLSNIEKEELLKSSFAKNNTIIYSLIEYLNVREGEKDKAHAETLKERYLKMVAKEFYSLF